MTSSGKDRCPALTKAEEVELCQPTVTNGHKSREKPDPSVETHQRIYRQVVAACIMKIAMGLADGTIGPSLPDLSDRLQVGYKSIASALIFKSVGDLLGSACSALLLQRVHGHVQAVSLACGVVMITALCCIPYAPSVDLLSCAFFFYGAGKLGLSIANSHEVLSLLSTKATWALYVSNFCYGVGYIISPQITKPFLSNIRFNQSALADVAPAANQTYLPMNDDVTMESNAMVTELPGSDGVAKASIEYAYLINTGLGLISLLFYLIIHLTVRHGAQRKRRPSPTKHCFSVTAYGRGSFSKGIVLLPLLLCFSFVSYGLEKCFMTYIYSYAVKKASPTSSEAGADLTTAISACSTLWRVLCGVGSFAVSINNCLLVNILLCLVNLLFLALWAESSNVLFWVLCCVQGVALSALFPGLISWGNLHMDMNPSLLFSVTAACISGDLVLTYITGVLFESSGPQSLFFTCLVLAGCAAVLYGFMFATTKVFHCRRSREDPHITQTKDTHH